MKNMKVVVGILLCMMLCISTLAGCGQKSEEGDMQGNSDTENTAAEATNEDDKDDKAVVEEVEAGPEPVELIMWVTTREQDDFAREQEQAFLDENPHITLTKIVKEGDPGNELYQAVAAGNAPDVSFVSFTMMDKYIKAGILEPLNAYVEAWKHGEGLTQSYVEMFTVDGNMYGVPQMVAPMFFGYNKSLFAEAGLEGPPATWEETVEYAEILTDKERGINGYTTVAAEWTEWYFQYYVWQAGGDLTKRNEDGTLELTFTDPAVIKAAEYYQELAAKGVLQSDLTLKFGDIVERFAAGKTGMFVFAGDWVSWATSLGMNPDDIGLSVMPAGPGGSFTNIGGTCGVITASASQAKKDAAWQYIEFMGRPDNIAAGFVDKESKGAVNPMVIPRDDLNLGDIVEMSDDYAKVLEDIKVGGRLEFEGKAVVGIYVDRVVQKILTDPNADPEIEFAKAQELAQKEVIDQYNADVLADN